MGFGLMALGVLEVFGGSLVDPIAIPADVSVRQAVDEHFLRHGFGGHPVVSDGRITGVVSLRQVKDCPPEERPRRKVRDVMRPADGPMSVPAGASAADALRRMGENDTGRLLVTEDGRVVGMITRTGITRFIQVRTELDDTIAAA
jgi:predicted transcriptional regulator